MTKLPLILVLIASMASCRSGIAQQPTPPLPVYDVVAIRLSDPLSRGTHSHTEDATLRARNVTLKSLLADAYGIREGQISGLPPWADSLRFDVDAKVTDADVKVMRGLTPEQREAMLATVLADRFHLQAHIETKTLPVYELVVAKDGPKLKLSAAPPDPVNPDNPRLGSHISVHNDTDLTATNVGMSELVGELASPLDRTVIDKTDLTGRYDFHLQWTPDNLRNSAIDHGAAEPLPDIFTAIEEQLGLKLESSKGPVKILVIDHAEKPSDN